MSLWDNFTSPPQISELDDLAEKRKIGLSTKDCKEDWCCPKCKQVFPPTKNLLVNLPHYACDSCQIKNPTVHFWKIPDTSIEGVSLEFMVYDQGNTRHCAMYSSIAALDSARRVRGAMCGLFKCTAFDVLSALSGYQQQYGFECGSEPDACTLGYDNFPLVLTFLKHVGAPYSRGEYDSHPVGCLKIKDYFQVPKDDISLMKRLLANGFPLLTGVFLGSLFKFVNDKEVYICAKIEDASSGHALVIIGCGIGRNKKGELETYFIVRDSSGFKAHSDYLKQGLGGDMLIWHSDIYVVWGFRLEDEKLEPEELEP